MAVASRAEMWTKRFENWQKCAAEGIEYACKISGETNVRKAVTEDKICWSHDDGDGEKATQVQLTLKHPATWQCGMEKKKVVAPQLYWLSRL